MGKEIVNMTASLFKEKFPGIYAEIKTEGITEGAEKAKAEAYEAGNKAGLVEGAKIERERIEAVEEQSLQGFEAITNSLKFDGKTTGEQAAVKILQAQKAKQNEMLAAIKKEAPPAVDEGHNSEPVKKNPAAKAEEEWDNNPELQAEFMGSKEVYDAFQKNKKFTKVWKR